MMENNLHNKLLEDIGRLTNTVKLMSIEAEQKIEQIKDPVQRQLLKKKLKEAKSNELDIQDFIRSFKIM